MNLIVTEQIRTHSAFMIGEEFTDSGSFEVSLNNFCGYLAGEQRYRLRRLVMREGVSYAIIIDLTNSIGIVISRFFICYNPSDRDKLLAKLGEICQPAPMGT